MGTPEIIVGKKGERNINRGHCVQIPVTKESTGLAATFYAHVDYAGDAKTVIGLRFSVPGKEKGSSLDRILHAVSDAVTEVLKPE